MKQCKPNLLANISIYLCIYLYMYAFGLTAEAAAAAQTLQTFSFHSFGSERRWEKNVLELCVIIEEMTVEGKENNQTELMSIQ